MTTVIDASLVIALLVDDGPTGDWADSIVERGAPISSHLMPAEVASVLRRLAIAGKISDDAATLAHDELLDLEVELVPYRGVAHRAWALRSTVTSYDAWYVAVAEAIGAPLATVDHRLSRATGPTCTFLTPPEEPTPATE